MFLKYYNKAAILIVIAVFFVTLDRLCKIYAINYQNSVSLIGGLLKFNFVKNYNIAFSLPLGGVGLYIIIIIIIIALFIVFFRLLAKNRVVEAGLFAFLLLGAFSNLFDRLKYGFVIDYFDLKYFTVFNAADIMIVGSVIFLIVINFKKNT